MTRSWIVVPAAGIACGAIAFVSRSPGEAVAIALTGAALAAAVRAFAGPSSAASASAVIAALIGALALLAVPGLLVRAPLAAAAAAFAIAELVRPAPPEASPWPAIGAATVAGMLDPSFVALIAISGWKLLRRTRPRYTALVPAAGVIASALAVAAAVRWPPLWTAWADHPPHALDALHTAALVGDALGPIAAVAAIAGLGIGATRGRYGLAAMTGVAAGSALVCVRCDVLSPAVLAVGALATGIAIARLAALVRVPSGQVVVGVTAGLVAVASPALVIYSSM